MKRFLREPILHFLVGGSIVFGLLSWLVDDVDVESSVDSARIVIEREALLAFVQAKTKVADESKIRRAFAEFDSEMRQEWIDRFVREEALVREARALGLDREDQIIRRRLAQKIEFLTLGLLEEELRLDEAELEAFYWEHREDYRVPTTLTMTHVYIDVPVDVAGPGERRKLREGSDGASPVVADARDRAESLLASLNDQSVSFRGAVGFGDRFLYNRNYVDRTIDEIRSHFGNEIAEAMERIEPGDLVWRGPYRSAYGWHLILLKSRTNSRLPELAVIAPMLRDDALRERREDVLDKAINAVISKYQVDQTSVDTWTANLDLVHPNASESPAP